MTSPATPALHSLKIITLAMAGASVIVAAIGAFVLPFDTPPWWTLAVVAGLALAASAGSIAAVVQTPAQNPGTSAEQAWAPVRSTHVLRLALLEMPMMVGLILGFLAETAWPALVGGALAAGLLLWLGFPSGRVLRAYETQLNRKGADIRLG